MSKLLSVIKNTWRKNWPEVHCGLTGGMPGFIFASHPKPSGTGVPVFCYHVIGEDVFRADLAFLKRNGYTTLTAAQLHDHLTGRFKAPAKSVVLSFDDGHASLYDTVYPLLREYDYQAVSFIVPPLHRDESEAVQDRAMGLCTWPEILEMHESGRVDFQAHTNSHRYVPDWPRALELAGVEAALVERRRPEPTSLADDLRACKASLEKRLNKPVEHLAFPQYYGTDEAITMARGLGYRAFWWGVLPRRAVNGPGDPPDTIVRVSGEFVRRLPGDGRVKLSHLLRARYGKRISSP